MDGLFERLSQVAASGALPYEQQQAVRALLRLRAAGWEEAQAAAAPALELLPKEGRPAAEAEDWRSVLDRRQAEASADGSAQGGGGEATVPAALEPAAPEPVAEAAAPAEPAAPPQASLERLRQEAVAAMLAAVPAAADAAWDVPALAAAVRSQAGLDLSAEADAEQLAVALADRAAAAAAEAAPGPDAEPLQVLPAIIGCAGLLADLSGGQPAVGAAASARLGAAFRRRSEARSREARRHLAQQMLLAGCLAQRGALAEQQLHGMLEQLARQVGWAGAELRRRFVGRFPAFTASPGLPCFPADLAAHTCLDPTPPSPGPGPASQVMKPSAWDVVCLAALLRGAGPASESRKGQWWKAAQQVGRPGCQRCCGGDAEAVQLALAAPSACH